jgi:hypothetical protein
MTTFMKPAADITSARARRSRLVLAWEGWQVQIPGRWSPTKLSGDYRQGYALFADLHRPRLGLRWHTPRKRKFDSSAWSAKAMREEVGQLAAAEASPHAIAGWEGPLLFAEPEPPGRDVWMGYSPVSGRTLQVVYYAHRRERVLTEVVLPTLRDLPRGQPMAWSIFELSAIVPRDLPMRTHRLNAGDLSLTFGNDRRLGTVRQIAVATLALQRMGIEKWLLQQQRMAGKYYRVVGKPTEVTLSVGGGGGDGQEGRPAKGVKGRSVRRRRFFFLFRHARELFTYAMHDAERDRLVLVQASDDNLARSLAAACGAEF